MSMGPVRRRKVPTPPPRAAPAPSDTPLPRPHGATAPSDKHLPRDAAAAAEDVYYPGKNINMTEEQLVKAFLIAFAFATAVKVCLFFRHCELEFSMETARCFVYDTAGHQKHDLHPTLEGL